jgi:hypothetical protein
MVYFGFCLNNRVSFCAVARLPVLTSERLLVGPLDHPGLLRFSRPKTDNLLE